MSNSVSFCYRAYGLTIASDLSCPEWFDANGSPDVRIHAGSVAERLPEAIGQGICYETAPGVALVRLDGIGRFLIRDGREVVYDRAESSDDDSIRLFLFGICLGILLQQRGNHVLHATTVARDGQAIALAGPSGAGKSTLAAALLKRGFSLLADEASCISVANGVGPLALPGAPSLLLWRHALDGFGDDATGLRRVRPQLEKYVVPARERFTDAPQALRHLIVIRYDTRHTVTLERLSGFERFQSFVENTFRDEYHSGLGLLRQRQIQCSRIVPHVQAHRLSWSQRWPDIEAAAQRISSLAS